MTASDQYGSTAESPATPLVEAEDSSEKTVDVQASEPGSFDIPRPMLTMQQAAAFLGKSVRALERSLMGRWGNKLPDGWSARKVKTDRGDEWRIVPPPGFRVRSHAQKPEQGTLSASEPYVSNPGDWLLELGTPVKRALYRSEHSLDQPAIVIDRSEEVEHLLRELLVTQKALSEERRLHMEDLRIVAQLQGSMRLLESSASESARAKSDLEYTRRELETMKVEYNQLLRMPWWKRLFGFQGR